MPKLFGWPNSTKRAEVRRRAPRFRLPARPVAVPGGLAAPGPGPVVLVLPARDEEATVAAVVARAPRRLGDREVCVVVVDDGSSDQTAALARSAGADVVSLSPGRGLGAAVRTGLAHALAHHGAAVVAFCDADGEYAPEDLHDLVRPVLEGRAHYVVGSRFRGTIESMQRRRRAGNLVLTAILRQVARERLSDGQSGYRALSRDAAAHAVIVHDYNYAQVLTLDLLAKGYGYHEVPIRYRFRTSGRSFVKLRSYVVHVVPAVYRQLNNRQVDAAIDSAPEATPATAPPPTALADARSTTRSLETVS